MTKARTLADNFAADINGITAGTGITGGGTSGTVTVTNSMATAIDAKGDLVVGTGADTFSRLAVASTAGYLLSVDSAESTGLKWAAPASGSMTLLSTITLSSNTVTYSSIPTGYKLLRLVGTNNQSTLNNDLDIEVNGGTTGVYVSGVANGAATQVSNGKIPLSAGSGINENDPTTYVCDIWNYDSSSVNKVIALFGLTTANFNTTIISYTYGGVFKSNTAITSLEFFTSSGTLSGTVLVYGVN
jgi:hypothetical protein